MLNCKNDHKTCRMSPLFIYLMFSRKSQYAMKATV